VVIEPAVIVELPEQLLDRERELDEQENALLTREHAMVEAERALERVRMECDTTHDRAGVIKHDYCAQLHASTASRRHSLEFDWVLSGRRFVLSMQEIDPERQEEELADDQARGLYPPDGRDLPLELDKLRKHVAEVEDDRAIEAKQLSQLTMEISNALVDLNVMPIQGIPSQPWSVKDVMVAFGWVLEQLRKEVTVREPNA
jgi:hypothetical protein